MQDIQQNPIHLPQVQTVKLLTHRLEGVKTPNIYLNIEIVMSFYGF